MKIPKPDCELGYPRHQLEQILGDDLANFDQWMSGQTQGVCDGRSYDHDARVYEPTSCAGNSHGPVVYTGDLRSYLSNGRSSAPVHD